MTREKAIFCWSGGKDSALCLHRIKEKYEIVSLLTTVNSAYGRISMHGVREQLLDLQCKSIGLPLHKISLGNSCCNEEYEQAMRTTLEMFKSKSVSKVIFGDIFLQDLKEYRQKQLATIEMEGIFPLWMESTKDLVDEFIQLGFKGITCCVSDAYLDKSMVGRFIDNKFIESLPSNVDPCGEYGEFHSFTYDGPIFEWPVKFSVGEKVYRQIEQPENVCSLDNNHPLPRRKARGHWYCDLVSKDVVAKVAN